MMNALKRKIRYRKRYVEVIVKCSPAGEIIPLAIYWPDNGELYEIDKVLDIRPAASLKAGGAGIRYQCRIQGKETFLWLEENKWFVEEKVREAV